MARNILVVEDDPNIVDLLRMYLEKEGFEVRIAMDGGKAVEEFKTREPDIILLDIMLPVMDGWASAPRCGKQAGCPSSCSRRRVRCRIASRVLKWARTTIL